MCNWFFNNDYLKNKFNVDSWYIVYMYLYIGSGEYIKYECNMLNDNILFYGV